MSIANVMLVDDEVPFVETMSKRLIRRELNITTAFSGEEALKKLDEDQGIEVIILDVKMPGIDGIETLRQIKIKYPITEVIMLTGHGDMRSVEEGMNNGAFEYIMKPVDIGELTIKINKAWKKKQSV